MRNDRGSDEQRLEAFGYRQELERRLGYASSFALSFSVISVTTGLFANYGDGLRLAGPAFIWTWPVVGAGQFLVALLFARLARCIPVSGYAYQWTRELAGTRLAWWAGWMMIIQFIAGLPGVCYALANYLAPFLGLSPTNRHIVILTIGTLAAIALINHFGINLASLVNNVSVATEILGTVAVGILLLGVALLRGTRPWGFLFSHPDSPAGLSYISPFAFSSVMSAWTLTGFESAANLAEETRRPERRVPGAIIFSEVSSVVLGFLVLLGFTLAIPSLAAVSSHPTPLLFIMSSYFPDVLTRAVMLFVFISIFACALANLTTLTRTVWAMARDHQLPASRWLARVSARRVPARSIWAVTALSSLFVLWAKVEIVIVGIAALAGYVTYALVVGAALWTPRGRDKNSQKTITAGTEKGVPQWAGGESVCSPRVRLEPNFVPRILGGTTLAWLLVVISMLSLPHSARRNTLALIAAAALGLVCYYLRPPGRNRAEEGRFTNRPYG